GAERRGRSAPDADRVEVLAGRRAAPPGAEREGRCGMTKCSAWIRPYKETTVLRQCARPGSHEENGDHWCRQHRPSVVEAKRAKGNAAASAGFDVLHAKERALDLRHALMQEIW